MASRFTKYKKALGFVNAIGLYKHIKLKSKKGLKLSFVKTPVYFRGIRSDELMFEQIFINKEYAIKVPFKPEIILDLGANVGYASLYFITRFPDARIIAVEPEENNFKAAVKNLEHYKNIELIRGAVWNISGIINVIDSGYGEAAYMVQEGLITNPVKALTVEEIIRQRDISQIDILKIDIEGAEKELFDSGYESWLPLAKILIIETHDRYKPGTSRSLCKAICQYDFSLELSGENLVFYNNRLVNIYQ